MKKHLCLALAALAFAACDKETDPVGPVEKGEMEQSYLAVSLLADDMATRAAGDEYEDGDASERVVKNFYFFLFDEKGQPFEIDGKTNYKAVEINESENDFGNNKPTAPEGDTNETPNTPEGDENGENTDPEGGENNDPEGDENGERPSGEDAPNVSDIKDKVLVFENYKGEYPAKIVAVLNWTPATDAVYTLDALAEQLAGLKNTDDAFVMSNSVYASESSNPDAGKEAIKATPLSPANIAKSEEDALANPVQIYVERIAAKVTVNTTAENKYETGEVIGGKKVYAQVTGWDLHNAYNTSYLIKQIDPTWTGASVGFSWNDAAWFRSYWAKSPTTAFGADNKASFNTLTNAVGASDYCGENTYRTEGERTMVVVKAQLVDENGTSVEVASWYGHDYVGEEALRTVVANTLASQLYYMDGTEYKSIEPAHLMVKEADEHPNPDPDMKPYHVFFQLSTAGEAKEWYTYSTTEGFKVSTKEAVNVILGGVEPALLYKSGQTYYFTDIKHLPSTKPETQYGVVRNHVYKVNITSIAGLGTPVFDGNTQFVPVKPEDITTYVSAEVRVLSWRVVEHDYDI